VHEREPGAALTPADERELSAAFEAAATSMTRTLHTDGLHEALLGALGSAHWDEIAERCLACGNCTAVCPTCFCTRPEDLTDLSGTRTERWQVWDTCYSLEFTRLGAGHVRPSTASRYRQWLVHKLGTWHDQFGESGCVGCGRCITWCPVGIDLTAEIPLLVGEPS
jgi:ferredoxin